MRSILSYGSFFHVWKSLHCIKMGGGSNNKTDHAARKNPRCCRRSLNSPFGLRSLLSNSPTFRFFYDMVRSLSTRFRTRKETLSLLQQIKQYGNIKLYGSLKTGLSHGETKACSQTSVPQGLSATVELFSSKL